LDVSPELDIEPDVALLPDDGDEELALLELGDDGGVELGVVLPDVLSDVDEPVLPGDVAAVLLGVEVSLLLLEVLDGGVVLAVLEGEVDELDEVEPVPACLSQPVTAAPARARTATTGMSFFMNFSN
jgi:hypothetical protein